MRRFGAGSFGAVLLGSCAPAVCMPSAPDTDPIILITDLAHPGGDPDDHIDLAVTAGLDMNVAGLAVESADGAAPVAQMAAITDTDWPTVIGDDGADLVLDILADSAEPVTIVTVGSLTGVAEAFRRNPSLLRAKVERVVVFGGDAAVLAPVEYNVGLDPTAFVEVMSSGLAIRWVPCFDGGPWQAGTRSSFVQTAQADLLPASLPDPVERYFAYRLTGSSADPISWLNEPVSEADRRLLDDGLRNVWAAGLIDTAVGGDVVRFGGRVVADFEHVTVRLNDAGQVDPAGTHAGDVERWRVRESNGWRLAMIDLTVAALLAVD